MKGPVVLIGMMGSGKTSVGGALARLLALPWADLDQALERRFKRSVAKQFELDGEALFRRRERDLLREICGAGPGVLSTGGGVVLDPLNRAILRKNTAVYLSASTAVLSRRLGGAQAAQRPLLRGAGGREAVLRRLAAGRGPLYRSCAAFTVLASKGGPADVARRIAERLLKPC